MRQLVEKVYRQPVFISPSVNIRYAVPQEDACVTPAHQDHDTVRQTTDFRTLWVSLVDIDESMVLLIMGCRVA